MKHLLESLGRNLRMGLKDILLHKLRALLTTLGMVFGVGSVIAMLAIGEGAGRQALDQIQRLGVRNILAISQKPVDDLQSGAASAGGRADVYGLKYEDEFRIRALGPDVERTVPVRAMRKEGRLKERRLELRVVGTEPAWFEVLNRPLVAGRVLVPRDLDTRSAVCVLTEQGARKLLAREHAVGEYIRIDRHFFRIIGVIKGGEPSSGLPMPDEDVDAYIPMNVCLERFGEVVSRRQGGTTQIEWVELHQIVVQVRSQDRVEAVAAAIEAMLARFHKKRDYRLQVPVTLLKQARATQRTFNAVLGSIAGISLLVGGIGIMNIMLASVTERTREIGIRRALGAQRWQIVAQFLAETVVLSMFGGVLGIGLGLLIPLVVTHFSGLPALVPFYSIPLSVGISVFIGVVFGLYPAVRAARLDPIEALRHE